MQGSASDACPADFSRWKRPHRAAAPSSRFQRLRGGAAAVPQRRSAPRAFGKAGRPGGRSGALGSMEYVEPAQKRQVISELLIKSLKSSSETDTRGSALWQFRRKDTEFCAYLRRLLNSPVFTFLMICSISLNAIFLAVETDYRLRLSSSTFFALTDTLILSIYTSEFLMKVYVDPITYWKDGYNVLDAVILLIAFILYASSTGAATHFHSWETAKGLQALRILKLIKYSNGMRIFTKALGQMVKTVMYVLILLFLLMFIFAILGHGLYGVPETGDTENWGNMEAAFFTLFSLVTVDGWTDLQQELEDHGFTNSHVFTIVFILLGFFVFFNMFIGVVIIKMQNSTQSYEQECKAAKKAVIWAKKQAILKKQQEEANKLTCQQFSCPVVQAELKGEVPKPLEQGSGSAGTLAAFARPAGAQEPDKVADGIAKGCARGQRRSCGTNTDCPVPPSPLDHAAVLNIQHF
ncbi:cation channel sperm-associated protein 3 isoform X2 [Rhea pennata]|uniref:cation channel sperm-associated protein 3 isoform X2 n=1 Tax=Rhea pennata TaxID=8795 RepID=UPI002E25F3D6